MKAIVTGGAGFIGSHLVDALISRGLSVHVIDNLSSGKAKFLNPLAKFYEMDISSSEAYNLILTEKPDFIFHMAAQADVSQSTLSPVNDMLTNAGGTLNLLEACRHFPIKNFIFSSTSAVYGNVNSDLIDETHQPSPISFYGLSKLTAENYIKLYFDTFQVPFTILRYGNVYGPRQTSKGEGGVIAVFLEKLLKNEQLKINGDGLQTRDYIYVQDVVEANIAAAIKEQPMTIQISTGKRTSILQLIELLDNYHSSNILSFHTTDRQGDIKHSCLDNSLAKRLLTWEPHYSIEKGLKETYLSYPF
ncbi:NAD-dependent epimerase/dehydratase family protein [Bacillus sp. es.034]|uniref:NAD-dependent epimerase/dehydratase family protein n=1 Tax=Bacillus sp. es.034 TaxID=1761763 RepID=UPI000BF37BD4|nr:NAD-dependent epimerase/dehydratase family protein [Bacillus sp. es.034]PFG06632.1 UDP-glucose 4-epimerase [Bacillus sp. es.034]